jgi:hypothetical protein
LHPPALNNAINLTSAQIENIRTFTRAEVIRP